MQICKQKLTILQQKKALETVEKEAIQTSISSLPEIQQDFVKMCFTAANVAPNRRRYSKQIISECLQLRIKSNAAYEHLRSRNILPLPSENTLQTYISNLDCEAGFKPAVFDTLGLWSGRMEIYQKQGLFTVLFKYIYCIFITIT